jgi:hypothetical protein
MSPIAATDIHFRLSGGAANASQNASLGGAKSTTTDASASLFDDVTGAESASGDTEYRGVYVSNEHGTLAYLAPRVWISPDTPSADTDADIALAVEAVNVAMATITDENTAPAGVTFANTAISYATGLAIPDVPAGQYKGVWLKRVVNAGAAAFADSFTVNVQGDTNP